MKKNSSRRIFLKNIGLGGLAGSVLPSSILETEKSTLEPRGYSDSKVASKSGRDYNGVYKIEFLNRVAFPIGGIGAGMYCIEGTGSFSHMSIRNQPDVFNEPGMFAAISVKGIANGAKVLEGPIPDWKKFGQRNSANGSRGSVYGLPHFQEAEFKSKFPFCTINLHDSDLPLNVQLTGWSPFIPTDQDNSSLPCGMVEYEFQNTSSQSIETIFSFNSRNFMAEKGAPNKIESIENGFILTQEEDQKKNHLSGNFAVFTDQKETQVDHCWFRGGWFDPITLTWETIRKGEIVNVPPVDSDAPGASLFVPFSLSPGEKKTIRLMTCWYVPISEIRKGKDSTEKCEPGSGCCNTTKELGITSDDLSEDNDYYTPWYSNRFKSILEVVQYWKQKSDELRKHSATFSDSFYNSTLPPEVIEAVAANLTILKSPTLLRQHDGRLWAYEGCNDNSGCCYGSCTHVWNYAQALPHLFPALERTLRHTEFCESQNKDGHQTFRSALPIRPVSHTFYSAADGQLGGIMKVYREWRISGDTNWLEKMYPLVKTSMDYCIRTWDPKGKGILEEPHHNTYDIEFWGPNGMCSSFYLGALSAMVRMGKFLKKDIASYESLFIRGKKFVENELFDGEYFIQKIMVDGLEAANPVEASAKSIGGHYSEEAIALLKKEGPKYQYGKGCLSDGVLGSWIASMCGLDEPLDRIKTTSHLLAVHKYNLKGNLSDHANPQRPSFALGNEGGLLLCSWPKGGKISLPFVYSNEVWTGIEYQVASHLMLMGKVEQGLDIVRHCRNRYDGRVRNPFDEYECGHWYARALSSYGLLQGLTGMRYDSVDQALYIDSKVGDYTSFLSTEKGFGNVSLVKGKPSIRIAYGEVTLKSVYVSGKKTEFDIT